jgi:hypothetical protein
MRSLPAGAPTLVALLAVAGGGLAVFAGAQPATAPAAPDSARPQKSMYGTLDGVHDSVGGITMKTDAGRRVGWKVHARVLAEAAKFKVGDPMIVIYRQISPNEKRVTAVAFPGTAATPLYLNTTGSRVTMRSSPMVDGVCGQGTPVTEAVIPPGGTAEVLEACWCCAEIGESCTPGNRTGQGRALLVACFD